jgi:biopolymer transport protein ExbD
MSMGGSTNSLADINVTPMIDILLVLLIIFMVIVPVTPKELDELVPQQPKCPHRTIDITSILYMLER